MRIHFPERFQNELRDKLGIESEDVFDAILHHDAEETHEIDGLILGFHQKYFPQIPNPYYLLVNGQIADDELKVQMAWKIFPSLSESIEEYSPLELLEMFAMEFGLPIAIGDVKRRFFFDESVNIRREDWRDSIVIENPLGHEYVQQIFTKTEEYEGEIRLTCALGVCIDIDRYRTWMANE